MADSDYVDCKEDQDADMFFNNTCYEKIPNKKESGKNAVVEMAGMMGKGSVDSNVRQNTATSVDNICYDTLPSKLN